MTDIHTRIRQLRTLAAMSMEQLAERVGVSWQTVQQWEKTTAPKRTRIAAGAAALGVTPEYLLTGAEVGSVVRLVREPTQTYSDRGLQTIADAWPLLPSFLREQWVDVASRALIDQRRASKET